ncbi:MAG: SDR family oxidoreductase [Desulfovibrionaceae bacterium]|nr:SDR family oxidoreductase [Desulfovibrionaceae bacterium]
MNTIPPVVIVTGAASNIGLACARRFAADHTVILADIIDAGVEAARLPQARAFKADVSDFAQCQALVAEAQKYGRLDSLVHCAAITKPACSIEEMSIDEWEQVIRINLTGAFYLAKACIPAMSEAGGSMVLFTSRAAKTGFAALGSNAGKTKAHYCASKAGVISLVKSLATELAGRSIRVNSVAPGPVAGTMIPKEQQDAVAAKVPLGRVGTPEEMAEAAYFLCSPAAGFITGHVLDVNGGTLMD